jgi:hypothetical protein
MAPVPKHVITPSVKNITSIPVKIILYGL